MAAAVGSLMMSSTSIPARRPASIVAFRRGSLKNAGTVMTACLACGSFNAASCRSLRRIAAWITSGGSWTPRIGLWYSCFPMSRLTNWATASGS